MSESLLKRISNGDKTAVQECLKKYGGLVWSLAKRMSSSHEDAEDAVQEIFVDVWKNAARFDENQAGEATFISMIARRRLIDRLRYSNRRLSPTSLDEELNEPAVRSDETLLTSIEARQAAKALEQIRPEQRKVLELSIVQGMSHQEISEATGIPLGTVKTHARRGLMQVRELLGLGTSEKSGEVSI
jgi:RNA polymerase sigma-70 factor (ECF subfamily)